MEFLFSISQKNNKKFYKLTADDKESAEKIFTAKMTPYIDQKFMDMQAMTYTRGIIIESLGDISNIIEIQ